MHELLCEGTTQIIQQLRGGGPCNADDARGQREVPFPMPAQTSKAEVRVSSR